ncbi:MAG TPA: Ni/Fe hydrogenase subunit gamma [candidate division Zixibacteria bacterium]|nr:Ni/Fe hydrogenase subunit gamma [candidate division Zixibacteria bacterium]HBZ00727.1 Ni/Fe hydrogenase subunit gamma [candidate division Zixibacteria bacterium]
MANKIENQSVAPEEGRDPMMTYPYYVQKVRQETYDTFTLELKPAKEQEIGPFEAGQFNMLYVFGLGEVPISISGDPDNPERLIHTTRAVGPVTQAMRKLRRGNMLGVRGPFGTNWPVDKAVGKDVMIITGGIGLAPLRPAIYHILNHRDDYGKVSLLYGARTPEDLLYTKELEKWGQRSDLEVHISVDRASGDWKGNVGVVTTLIPKSTTDPKNTLAMICGPEIMMRFTIMDLQKRGLQNQDIFISMERNMKCGLGVCGHCQLGGVFVCKDGPVFRYDNLKDLIAKREI